MKSTLALGLLAGLASASYHHPRHLQNQAFYRRDNGTVPTQTALTVEVTQSHTVWSCAPTVTNCPLRNNTGASATASASAAGLTPAVVTEVVGVWTTLCPATAASSIASSARSAYSGGALPGTTRTVTATADLTSAASPEETSAAAPVVSTSYGQTTVVATLTVGPASSQSVMTTTLQSQITEFVTVTASPVAAASGSSPVGSDNDAGDDITSRTSTTTSTSMGTRTITLSESSTATVQASSPSSSDDTGATSPDTNNQLGSSASGSAACIAETITVTQPASTVYVTMSGAIGVQETTYLSASSSPSALAVSAVPTESVSTITSTALAAESTGSSGDDSGDDECEPDDEEPSATASSSAAEETGDDDECEPDEPESATATAIATPYPKSNGTFPVPSGVAQPSGSYKLKH